MRQKRASGFCVVLIGRCTQIIAVLAATRRHVQLKLMLKR